MKTDITTELVKFIIGDTHKVTRLSFSEIMELFNDVHEIGEKDTTIGDYPNQILLIKGIETSIPHGNRKRYAEAKLSLSMMV
jgi:hypothetical protein